ncbi:bifunctional 4-hydroxy-2-oxoglutarate aldolase/2-dehydro-3-deoxy-phosphogluconate aldolase [Humibacillus sp. DSM 29435]|uniref:bifunctional 4-hydroxy-2-oxoglutarate aldolase/2-dehydro-3-deoxy-phosphogluconate aldolase n=1 Tax=Humibacillus sp. DSM 29435 TaxID=1869167 RepID=UPI000B21BF15|nr:bifunctional 4-hydroxy-2-oxoglutarate aldolase/2-dehydro-3-deoxy-phosphogluconate aldolase [Humibacillus sp. DSM 29435]
MTKSQPERHAPTLAGARHRPTSLSTLTAIATYRYIAIVRAPDADTAFVQTSALLSLGAGVVEISLTTPDALDAIRRVVRAHPMALVGAGTVLDAVSAISAIRAGARLLVTPALHPEVIAAAGRYGVVVVPGCATPTEMLHAHELGAHAVKLFPARLWTPAALADVREALPQLHIVPTGGVSIDSVPAWLRAGAFAVGIGSALASTTPGRMRENLQLLRDAAAFANAESSACEKVTEEYPG